MRIPKEWLHLFEGDRIHTALPFHRIEAAIEALKADGYEFTPEPSPRGYWLLCEKSPNVLPGGPSAEGPRHEG